MNVYDRVDRMLGIRSPHPVPPTAGPYSPTTPGVPGLEAMPSIGDVAPIEPAVRGAGDEPVAEEDEHHALTQHEVSELAAQQPAGEATVVGDVRPPSDSPPPSGVRRGRDRHAADAPAGGGGLLSDSSPPPESARLSSAVDADREGGDLVPGERVLLVPAAELAGLEAWAVAGDAWRARAEAAEADLRALHELVSRVLDEGAALGIPDRTWPIEGRATAVVPLFRRAARRGGAR